jgi:hypothetical protein
MIPLPSEDTTILGQRVGVSIRKKTRDAKERWRLVPESLPSGLNQRPESCHEAFDQLDEAT